MVTPLKVAEILERSPCVVSAKATTKLAEKLGLDSSRRRDFIGSGNGIPDFGKSMWEQLLEGKMRAQNVVGFYPAGFSKKGALSSVARLLGVGGVQPVVSLLVYPGTYCSRDGFSADSRNGRGTAHLSLNYAVDPEKFDDAVGGIREIRDRYPDEIYCFMNLLRPTVCGQKISLLEYYMRDGEFSPFRIEEFVPEPRI